MEKILLIVDDNIAIIDIVAIVLEGLFDKVLTATSVEAAQELLSKNEFSFAILDINLEGRNGAEVIKYLIDHPENKNNTCPLMIVSGIINPQFIKKYSQRFSGILMKPFNHSDLRESVEKIMSGEPLNNPEVDLPPLKCDLPFPIIQLEQRVTKILDSVKKNAKLKQLFTKMSVDRTADKYISTHIGMLVNISTAIAIQMQWNTDKTLEKFVFAAYLHDMALQTRPDLARIKDLEELESLKDKLSSLDYKLVFEHPTIAARTMHDMPEIPLDVGVIVRQHHELPKEDGFPRGLAHNKIVPLSVIFIIAHDMTHFILENPKWTVDGYLAKAKLKFKGSQFQKVLSALSEIKC